MAMLPIFVLGVVVGGLVVYTINLYEQETPSETKLKIMENEIIDLKKDKKLLEDEISKLRGIK